MSNAKGTISDSLLNNALEMTQRVITKRTDGAATFYYTPCGSGKHCGHIVTVAFGRVSCDCAAFGLCKHVLSSVGRPALHAIFQLRTASDLETIDEIVNFYAPAIRPLPEALRNLVRLEIHHQRERVYRSGVLVAPHVAAGVLVKSQPKSNGRERGMEL